MHVHVQECSQPSIPCHILHNYASFQEGDPPPLYDTSTPEVDTPTSKHFKKGQVIVKAGYIGAPKGMKQVAWERGWHKPEGEGKMHGDKVDENDDTRDRTLSLKYVLESCWDFAHEKTALQGLVESRGHILRMRAPLKPMRGTRPHARVRIVVKP